jgi:TusA-related sulfurtransferase
MERHQVIPLFFLGGDIFGTELAFKKYRRRLTRGNKLKTHAEAVLDLRGAVIPVAMLEMTHTFDNVMVGGILEILVDDEETRVPHFKVLKHFHYEVLDVSEDNSACRVRLRKSQNRVGGFSEIEDVGILHDIR